MQTKNRFFKVGTMIVTIALIFLIWPKDDGAVHTMSSAEAAVMTQYATPNTLSNMYPTKGSLETGAQINYAIPSDLQIFNATPAYVDSNGWTTYRKTPMFQDLNGDGLVDMLYSAKENYNDGTTAYVLMNNGQGFNITYYCRYDAAYGGYYGHCAK